MTCTTHTTLHAVTTENIKAFKQINSVVLKSSYSEKWYKSCIKDSTVVYSLDPNTNKINSTNGTSSATDTKNDTEHEFQDDLAILAYYHATPVPPVLRRNVALTSTSTSTNGKHTWTEPPLPSKAIPCGALRAVIDLGPKDAKGPKTFDGFAGSNECTNRTGNENENKEDHGDVDNINIPRIYIMTIAVVAPFRGMGIGAQLIQHVIDEAKYIGIKEIYLHVHTKDEDSIEWYKHRGFALDKECPLVLGYYRKMRPPGDAYILTLNVDKVK